METVRTVFDTLINMALTLFNTALTSWGIFGSFLLFSAILRKIANTFNKLKG